MRGAPKTTGLTIALQARRDAALTSGRPSATGRSRAGRDHVALVLAVPQPGGPTPRTASASTRASPGQTEGERPARAGRRAPGGAKIVEAPEQGGALHLPRRSSRCRICPELRVTRVRGATAGRDLRVRRRRAVATGPGDARAPARDAVGSERTGARAHRASPRAEGAHQARARHGARRGPHRRRAPRAGGGVGAHAHHHGGRLPRRDRLLRARPRGRAGEARGPRADRAARRGRRRPAQAIGRRRRARVPRGPDGRQRDRGAEGHLRARDRGPEVGQPHRQRRAPRPRADRRVGRAGHPAGTRSRTRSPSRATSSRSLFPWGAVRSETYRFDGSKCSTKKGEVGQREQTPVAAMGGGTPERPPPHPPEPPTPKVSRGGDLGARVLEQYRADRGVGAEVAPKVDLKVQVAGGGPPERVVLLGRDIVVFGPGFKGGTGYAYLTLQQFADARDVEDLSARDLTGDGAADLIVRGVRHVDDVRLPGTVDEDTMFVYTLRGDALTRVFSIETAREQGGKRMQGLVQFVPAAGGKSFDVLSAPGRATGWTEKTYPWSQESPGSRAGGAAALAVGGRREPALHVERRRVACPRAAVGETRPLARADARNPRAQMACQAKRGSGTTRAGRRRALARGLRAEASAPDLDCEWSHAPGRPASSRCRFYAQKSARPATTLLPSRSAHDGREGRPRSRPAPRATPEVLLELARCRRRRGSSRPSPRRGGS